MPTTPPTSSVHIHPDGGDFILHPDDNDLFMRTGKQVIEACRLGISIDVWVDEFNNMLADAKSWCTDHSDKVRSCFCSPVGARITLFFSPGSEAYDFDLAELLAELNSRLNKQYNIGMVEVRQVPWSQIDRFIDPEKARLIYGDERPASPESMAT